MPTHYYYVHFFCLDTKETNQRKSQNLNGTISSYTIHTHNRRDMTSTSLPIGTKSHLKRSHLNILFSNTSFCNISFMFISFVFQFNIQNSTFYRITFYTIHSLNYNFRRNSYFCSFHIKRKFLVHIVHGYI